MEQEGTLGGQGSPQALEEEVGGERIPGTPYFLEEVIGERIPGTPYLLEDISRESIPGTPQLLEEVSEERIPGTPQFLEEISRERIPRTPQFLEEVSEESIPGTPQLSEEGSGERIPGTPYFLEEGAGERIPGIPQFLEEVGEDRIPGTLQLPEEGAGERIPGVPQFLEEVGGERIPGIPRFLEEISRERIPGTPQPLEEVGGERIPGIPQFLEEISGERIPGIPQFLEEISGERIPDATRESPAPSEEESREESLEQQGVSSPRGSPRGSQVEQPLQEEGTPLGTPPAVPGTSAEPPRSQLPSRDADFYCVKWIRWKGERTPVVTQSENGPCPLLAIINILLLQWKVKLPPQKEVITAEELMAHLGNCILATQPRDTSEGLQLNFQQNINDTMTVLPKLSTGLDVNVRFTGVSDFEYTPECIIFDLLNIPLYHGWLVDPQIPEQVQAVGKLSYNQLVEKIITCKQSRDSNLVSEGLVAEQFLESSASQLTFHGLCELTARAREGELGVFFRNNHFSTMIKHKGHLYLLVTDQGFLQEEEVVWESLHSVDGDSSFCDTQFHLSHSGSKEGATGVAPEQQRQLDQDYLVALSLQQQGQDLLPSVLSDLELARQLQHEEYQQQQQHPHLPPPHPHHPQPLPAQAGRGPAGERRQRPKADLDCTLL